MLEVKLVIQQSFSSSKPFLHKRFGGSWDNKFQNPKRIGSDVETELFGSRDILSLLGSNVLLVQKFGFTCISMWVEVRLKQLSVAY